MLIISKFLFLLAEGELSNKYSEAGPHASNTGTKIRTTGQENEVRTAELYSGRFRV